MKLLLAICCLVVVNAQLPQPCSSPTQWESKVLIAERSSQSHMDHRAKISYDEINQRVRIIDEYSFIHPTNVLYEEIFNHKIDIQKAYRINLQTRQCNVTSLTTPFRPFGVPPNATFDGFATVGASGISGEFMNVQSWSFSDGPNTFFGTVTYPDCVPVDYTEIIPPTSSRTLTYFNIQPGIRDPNVFTPPNECTMN